MLLLLSLRLRNQMQLPVKLQITWVMNKVKMQNYRKKWFNHLVKLKSLAEILKKALPNSSQPQEQLTTLEKVKKEIDKYIGFNLCWSCLWSTELVEKEAESLPALAISARKYLCLCGTSVPSECLFSKGDYIVNGMCCRLTPDIVKMLLILAKNMSAN